MVGCKREQYGLLSRASLMAPIDSNQNPLQTWETNAHLTKPEWMAQKRSNTICLPRRKKKKDKNGLPKKYEVQELRAG